MDVRKVPSPVKRVVHLGSRSYGRLTAPARMNPSFLICGGQRCGTTSLYRALAARYLADRQAEAGARLGVLGTWLLPVLIRRVAEL